VTVEAQDAAHMRAALSLARRGNGRTWPNPSVGCVIVKDGRVVGRATTAQGGRPHAEPQALAMAGDAARGATAYVTLEPCCFHGRTPPCTDALVAAGVARVVVGVRDPDPRVNGAGLARLRSAGIEVVEGVLEDEAADVVAGFVTRVQRGRPLVTLKLASTLDGRIATRTGESQWITGEPARRMAHALRGRHDAIMVGAGTVLADNPDLTCRIPGFKPLPMVRVVADSHLRLPLTSRLVATAHSAPTWVLCRGGVDSRRNRPCRRAAGAGRARHHPVAGRGRCADRRGVAARGSGGPAGLVPRPLRDGRRWLARGAGLRGGGAGADAALPQHRHAAGGRGPAERVCSRPRRRGAEGS
jgi:diaminohydroxyphosphoribosylaminopyrimidine deaminase/5-amino-6-(5-phosphoribosylamino)uracil reductase